MHRKPRKNWKKQKKRSDVTIHGDLGREKRKEYNSAVSSVRLVGSGD